MAKGNRNLKAKHEKPVRQSREASHMEMSKAAYRGVYFLSKDKRTVAVLEERKALMVDQAAIDARLARRSECYGKCTRTSRPCKGAAVHYTI
jgi:hypothetical protein